jgi:nitric oxide reductase subunit B
MKRLWIAFAAVILVSFAVLLWAGSQIYQQKPPIPSQVVSSDGTVVISEGEVMAGQNVWQAMGGMELGSIWGHGSYTAPDWTADWLHRECEFVLNDWSQSEYHQDFATLAPDRQAPLREKLVSVMRTNTYKESTGAITIPPERARAFQANTEYYAKLFQNGHTKYSIPAGTITDPTRQHSLAAFFFWTSWAASTNRPGQDVTYTSNWPHEAFVNNVPTPGTIVWTGVSIILLLAGIGGMVWYHAMRKKEDGPETLPDKDPFLSAEITPSQRAVVKYFWVVSGLILVQILLGVITAHYGVEGNGFYGIPLAKWLPYSVTRTWHLQLGIFWIATAWLAAGLYIAPLLSGKELKGQVFGTNFLFIALLVVVLGSLAGEWMSVQNMLSGDLWFYFGHQGYEYIDLGRVWQLALCAGLVLWVYLVGRHVLIALKRNDHEKPILITFLISAIAIGGFYFAGLGSGQHTNLAVAEYWRWWVVHLWVEGFFEVFATVVIAFMFARMKLIAIQSANHATVLSSTIFLAGGIIGTLHHLYFSGTPTVVLALGSVFSALEVVPLVLVGYEAWENIQLSRSVPWVAKYRWPIYFFVAVAFWNLVGAGLFGFMINPPIALYYMQGLNTTPVHGHAALFGVYGMLGIGLMLFCLRVLWVQKEWNEKFVKWSFWGMNIGLMGMVVISLLPVGLMQTWASVKYGYWYARSAEFLSTPAVQTMKWTRVFGDTIFALGAIALVLFVFGLVTGHSFKRESKPIR